MKPEKPEEAKHKTASALGIEKIVDVGKHIHLPDEVPVNDNKPVILTLRNTVDVLLGKKEADDKKAKEDEKGKTSVFKSLLSLKGTLIALGGLSALFAAGAAIASQVYNDTPEVPPPKKKPDDNSVEGGSDNLPDALFDNLPTSDSTGKGPASTPSLAKGKRQNPETMLSKGSGKPGGETVDNAVKRAASDSGEKLEDLRAIIHLESGGDPRARSTQFFGLGQLGKSAWADVQQSGVSLPPLTGDANDPRFDPYMNAFVTAKYMAINRKRIASASKAAGYPEPTLGLLYAAHNLGFSTVVKMLSEKDSRKWDAQTKRYVANQSSELTQGGVGNYLKNADQAMKAHYSAANQNVGSGQVAEANAVGVMSSANPVQLASSQRVAEPVQVAAAAPIPNKSTKVANVKIDTGPPSESTGKGKQVASSRSAEPGPSSGGHSVQTASASAPQSSEEPFRLKNGQMASL